MISPGSSQTVLEGLNCIYCLKAFVLLEGVSTIAPPHASDGFKTDSVLFLPHSLFFCWSDLLMWMIFVNTSLSHICFCNLAA